MKPQINTDEVKNDQEVKSAIEGGSCYAVLTAFPGNPDVPKASEWNGQYVVVLPKGFHTKNVDSPEVKESIFESTFKKHLNLLKESI